MISGDIHAAGVIDLKSKGSLGTELRTATGMGGHGVEAAFLLESVRTFP